MRRLTLFLISIFCLNSAFSVAAHAAEKRNQLEELLIWKMSDELKLNTTEEKKFSDIVREINKKKAQFNQELQASVEKMSKAATEKAKDEELVTYRKSLQNYGRMSEEEFDKLKPLLGPERMVQYLQIKQDLTNRIKTMLTNPEGSPKEVKPLPSPKLIEEK
ncbi:hypothetical protein EZJ49_00580 [Bdellovibrio bacteriovorus]|uniref:hypothetical protein n=1 Tax=Bdellovibrio bacteriovorus TaxID=959 RepID=UPI0021CFB6B3|nr:hypothetical protein [Bdellovibrio bacteriovorus]UXR64750.1 hypothetical protein EZJ49_00580 [Bdellovibrio bacteriovorus]